MLRTLNKTDTFGDWAVLAINKHLEKVLKHEDNVAKDRSPEDLHQMRVGMRRLRSAITGFAPVISLPKSAQEKKIGKIAHTLGSLRDLDVLKESLENQYKPILPLEEQKYLKTAFAHLDKQRRQVLVEVKDTLTGERYKSLKHSLKKWLKQPNYTEIAQMPICEVLPDLLLPEVSRLLLHPGWLVGTTVKGGNIDVIKELPPGMVEQQLAQGDVLHSLRKETKRIRYQMEVFSDFYGSTYNAYLEDMKTIQALLGQIQDSAVLHEFLNHAMDCEIKSVVPTLANQLTQKSSQAWQQWQTLQQRYLNLEIRKGFHLTILHPTFEVEEQNSLMLNK
jgi:CHAD domain-containing protein